MRVQHLSQLALLSTLLIALAQGAGAQIEGSSESATADGSSNADNQLRIDRPVYVMRSRFNGLLPGYSIRWLRNLRQPSFCKMVLCHGTCATPTRAPYSPSNLGMPSPSASDPESITNAETPCGLKSFTGIITGQPEGECPMSQQ
jgi:hypothetical protein